MAGLTIIESIFYMLERGTIDSVGTTSHVEKSCLLPRHKDFEVL